MRFASNQTMRQLQLFPERRALARTETGSEVSGPGASAREEGLAAERPFPRPSRIRYAVELMGTGIMMAGFLALALLG